MSTAKVQHYVPQFLLKNFGTGKKDKIAVFDKETDKTFTTNVRNVAAESRFYDFKVADRAHTIEPGLSQIEGLAKRVIEKVLLADSLTGLTAEDRGILSFFCAIQLTRTRGFREMFRAMPTQLKNSMLERGFKEEDLSNIEPQLREPDENELALMNASFIAKEGREFAMTIAMKDWLLIAADKRDPFIIGDNPIARQNPLEKNGPFGNLGLAVRGIEIYCPLSPVRALAMWCPSHRELVNQRMKEIEGAHPVVLQAYSQKIEGIRKLAGAFVTGAPLFYPAKQILNFNALQVSHAERYVFASSDDHFALARRMVGEKDAFRRGPRIKVM